MPEYFNNIEELRMVSDSHSVKNIYSALQIQSIENINMGQIQQVLTRILYYWLPKTEPTSRYIAENQQLKKCLDRAFRIEGDILIFEVQELADQFNISKHKKDIKELNNKILELAAQALKEFRYYLLKKNLSAKKAFAEAEGLKVINEGELFLNLLGKEFRIKFVPCQVALNKKARAKEVMQRVLGRIDRLLDETDAKIGNIWQELESSYVSKKLMQQLAPILDMLTKSFESIKEAVRGGVNLLLPGKAFQLEKNIQAIEREATELDDIIMSKLTDEDISNISMLTADIKDPQQILKIMAGVKDASNIADAIKLNIQNLQYEDFSKYKYAQDQDQDILDKNENIKQEFDTFLSKLESDLKFNSEETKDNSAVKIRQKKDLRNISAGDISFLKKIKKTVRSILPAESNDSESPHKMNFTI